MLDKFEDWLDFDEAEAILGIALGIFSDQDHIQVVHKHKGIFWSNNPVGNTLSMILDMLVDLKLLEKDKDNRYRRTGSIDHVFGDPFHLNTESILSNNVICY